MTFQAVPKLLLDTDPGGDDIFALLWLLSLVNQGRAELVAVTTTQGNVAAAQTFANASQVLNLAGYGSVPLGRGVLLSQGSEDASHIHGSDGMGYLSQTLPPPSHEFAIAPAADDLLIEQLSANPGEITLIAIGPLTNLAAAEAKRPGILQQARELVVMAGAIQGPGNVTAQAEFNVWFNPEAAQVVFNSRNDVVMLPLDVTRQLVFTETMATLVAQTRPEHPLAHFLVNLCQFMVSTARQYRETAGSPGFLVHDAATLGYLFYPETLLLRRATVQVETQGELTRGQTLIDRRHKPKPRANAWVALEVDAPNFLASVVADLQQLLRHHYSHDA
ncbi:Pyrimidine-specific ribonucleoside hydrolase RihA [Halomicronema hongdechloris C2206]|uniref:Pyrimidine-specific ribonucleoside hydrolase RihA n=1 Tax=Halomicronema hongdechloris C2206 TaxID=1641165 RepID=A0A1Z3HPS6_9CYAN|nr:nucleoside hydrolase [Halomicronema hongdechloris]ASC72314.1 Pyrimidine-specific ribonucleoside hydrolase RihA [Halomicronema hongdechloris C2206]